MSEEGLVALNEPNPELRGAEIEVPLLDVLPKPSLGCPETTRPYFDSIPPAFFPLGSYVLRSQPLKQEKLLFVIQCTVQVPHPRRPGGSLAPGAALPDAQASGAQEACGCSFQPLKWASVVTPPAV